jgi:2,3-dihydroxybenzoate decarboxylase
VPPTSLARSCRSTAGDGLERGTDGSGADAPPPLPADAVDLARDFDDELGRIVRDHPSRFAGLATVTPQAPQEAAKEIERATVTLGLHGIVINSHTSGNYLVEPQFAPLLYTAEAQRAPPHVHPRVPSMLGQYAPYGPSGAIWGYGAEAGLHAMRLIMSGTLDRCPNLYLVLGAVSRIMCGARS